MDKRSPGYAELIAGVIAISFSPLAVKLVDFTPVVSAFYRSLYAALFFLVFAAVRPRTYRETGHARWLFPSFLAGIFLGIDLAVWHVTIVYLGAGPATFMGNSQIIFVALFAALVFREHVPGLFWVFVAVILAGLYLLLPPATGPVSRLAGYGMGLVVGVTYAGMLICLRYAKTLSGDAYPEILSLGLCFAAAALTIGLYAVSAGHERLISGTPASHGLMAATALCCQTVGWFLINTSITRIPAHQGSLLLMLQPVLATAWGALLFREPLGTVQGAGILLSISGIALYQAWYAKQHGAPSAEESFAE